MNNSKLNLKEWSVYNQVFQAKFKLSNFSKFELTEIDLKTHNISVNMKLHNLKSKYQKN